MYSNTKLEELKKSVPIYFPLTGKLHIDRRGNEFWTNCLWHDDTNPSLSLYKASDGAWMFHCFGCGESGNIFQIVQKLEKVSFDEAVKIVDDMTKNPDWSKKKASADAVFQGALKSKSEIISLSKDNFKSYENALCESAAGREWLSSRGILLETAKQFSLGYVKQPRPDIVPTNHPWFDKGWILFPEVRGNQIVAVKYRSLQGKKIKDRQNWSGFAQRTDMIKSPLYNSTAVTPFEEVLVVEGEIDCLTLVQAGFCCVSLPSAGFNPTPEMRETLASAYARYLAGDTDTVGTQAMQKLYKEFGGDDPKSKTYLVQWPKPYKDANEVFLKQCGGDIEKFKSLVVHLMDEAKSRLIPGIQDLKTVAKTADFKPTHDNPNRLFFPWPNIDRWVDILPGEVMFMFATETKQGKSTWLMNILMANVLKGKKVINFSAELSPERYAQMVTSHLLKRNRTTLSKADFEEAAIKIPEEAFYIGYKPGAKLSEVMKLLGDAKQIYGGDIFVVDPLHFLIRGVKDENVAFAAAMRALVDFSIQWNVIVIVVGQARKSMNGNRGKMAQGQDARGTAALGEDAATTWVLHRNRVERSSDIAEEGEPVFESVTKIKLDYSRNSEPMSTKLVFDGPVATFRNFTSEVPVESIECEKEKE